MQYRPLEPSRTESILGSLMRRRQLFEFHDFPWYPEVLREAQTEILDLANHYTGFAEAISEPFAETLEETGVRTVLDLCSGAGGPVVQLQRALADQGVDVPKVLLSDRYPNVEVFRRVRAENPGLIDFVPHAVDATKVSPKLDGELITIINALHHFPPEVVWAILGNAVERGASIFVAEAFPRNIFRASAYVPALLHAVPIALVRSRHRRLLKLVAACTVLPFLGAWDWLASALRIHEPRELISTAEELAPHYRWRHGTVPFKPWGRAVYLVGVAS